MRKAKDFAPAVLKGSGLNRYRISSALAFFSMHY